MKIFSFDAETNGLYGQAFMLAAVVTVDGKKVDEFIARCPIAETVDDWVKDNVLPQVENVEVSHSSYDKMLNAFYAFYMNHKNDSVIIAHMAFPVEAKVLRDMIEINLDERGWDGPYPLIDVSAILQAKGFDPASVDGYNKSQGLKVPFDSNAHHPMFDSWAAEVCYRNLMTV